MLGIELFKNQNHFSKYEIINYHLPSHADRVRLSDSNKFSDYVNTPVSEPTPFAPGVISTEDHSEFSIAFSPDGLTAYFSRRAPEEKQKIYSTQFKDGSWTQPELMPFSTDRDESPFVTADVEWFFFGSERAIPGKPNKGNFDMNIWAMKQTSEGWSEPQPLDNRINQVQAEGEEWPLGNSSQLFSHDDQTFYFTAMMRGRAGIELYQTEFDGENFSDPVRIEGIFSDPKYWVHAATVSPDGQYLVFNSHGAPRGLGGEDIYVSKKTDTGWSEAVAIGNQFKR
jgi:Tol biopolymer transport system component